MVGVTRQALPRKAGAFGKRARLTTVHLLVSLGFAIAAATLFFWIWFPTPFESVTGASKLFLLLVALDVLLGPALTCLVATPDKPIRELKRDLIVIGLLQLGALGYGVYTASLARPVALVLEIDQFRLVTAADIETAELGEAPPQLRKLSWSGPIAIAVVKPSEAIEQLRVIDLELAGIPLAAMPKYWRPYSEHADSAWQKAKSATLLIEKYPAAANDVKQLAVRAEQETSELRFMPLRTRRGEWVTLLGPNARILGHLQLDGFI